MAAPSRKVSLILEPLASWRRRRKDRDSSRLGSPAARTLALSTLLLVTGVLLWAVGWTWHPVSVPVSVPWEALIPAFVLADGLVFHLELKGDAHTFNLSEIPLLIGFFFVPAHLVVLARVIGSTTYQLGRRRQFGTKLIFNLALFTLDASLILTFLHLAVGTHTPKAAGSWLLAFLAITAATQVTWGCISLAIYWNGGRPHLRQVMTTTAANATVNTGLGLLGADLLWDDPASLVLLALVLAITFAACKGYFNLAKRYASLQLLYSFTKTVSRSMPAETALNDMLAKARQLLQAERALIVTFDPARGLPTFHRWSRDHIDGLDEEPVAEATAALIWEYVSDRRETVAIPRTNRAEPLSQLCEGLDARDLVMAPLTSEDGVVGVMLVLDRFGQVSTFDEEDGRLFETLANHASVALDNNRLVHRLRREAEERRHEALHDALTGLPNRTLFSSRVEELLAAGEPAVVMLMDLDGFKEINDTLGHHSGDVLLGQVADRLRMLVRDGDMAARLGGDEFAVVTGGVPGPEVAEAVARRILAAFETRFMVRELSIEMNASIGISVAPEDGTDAVTLLQKADVAMYEAKSSRSGVSRYSAERDTYTPRRLALAGGLREAIERGDITVYFQPKVELAGGQVIGVEALARWKHPELGLVLPDEFIPIAEQTGLHTQLTAHVLRTALRQCRLWQKHGHDLGVAVNLTVHSLLDARLAESIDSLIGHSGLDAGHLTLEITESSFMADPERAVKVLNDLAAIGVRLSVDDFGTGYSSLSYLQRLPVDEVKVDKSFIMRMAADSGDAIIVESIVDLGHKLGLCVVAEGVENVQSWDRLGAMGCDIAQGYLLSKPVPARQLTAWLRRRAGSETFGSGPSTEVA